MGEVDQTVGGYINAALPIIRRELGCKSDEAARTICLQHRACFDEALRRTDLDHADAAANVITQHRRLTGGADLNAGLKDGDADPQRPASPETLAAGGGDPKAAEDRKTLEGDAQVPGADTPGADASAAATPASNQDETPAATPEGGTNG